jgi:hypothetical protein
MLLPEAADLKLHDQARLSREALLNLSSLIATPPTTGIHDNLPQTSVDGCKGGHHAAATTLKPDPNKRGTRAGRSDGKNRTGQSHGSRSGDGFSNGSKEGR